MQQIGLKRNFLWRVAQIIGSEIIQTDDNVFPKERPHFLSYFLDILTKIYQTLKIIFWDFVKHTEDPGT